MLGGPARPVSRSSMAAISPCCESLHRSVASPPVESEAAATVYFCRSEPGRGARNPDLSPAEHFRAVLLTPPAPSRYLRDSAVCAIFRRRTCISRAWPTAVGLPGWARACEAGMWLAGNMLAPVTEGARARTTAWSTFRISATQGGSRNIAAISSTRARAPTGSANWRWRAARRPPRGWAAGGPRSPSITGPTTAASKNSSPSIGTTSGATADRKSYS